MAKENQTLGRKERIRDILIEEEMKTSYLTYAMSVIVSRALPDVRDGLKPVQRRVLIAMNDLNLGPRSKHRKCAKIIGDTTGNYHPHGQEAVYSSLVRLGQDFNCRYPLIDPQGNFGSVDGDPPAAMRYTEARLRAVSVEILDDLQRDTVDFTPNYDSTREEPTVLPGRFPNLLCNGASGIAVGMATNMPPHNLCEVCDAIIRLIDDPEVTIDQLMKIIKGPDFPAGGLICGRSGIRQAYHTGRGTFVVRSKCHIESAKSGRKSIVFTEVPNTLNREQILVRIAALVKKGSIPGISDVRNESDRAGCRLVVVLKKGEDEDVILNLLYKHTNLQQGFGIMAIALVSNQPRTLNLKELLSAYRDHRVEVIVRRTRYLLARAEQRAHVLEGLLIALRAIDAVIQAIKESPDAPAAKARLVCEFSLSEVQAEAILQMRLQRLTGLERQKIQEEHAQLLDQIQNYQAILSGRDLVLDIIREDLYEIKEKYGDARRTEIVSEVAEFDIEDLVAEETVVMTVTGDGYAKRQSVNLYRRQGRGGKGITGASMKKGDFIEHLFVASTHDYILFFTDQGRIRWLKVYDIPEMGRTARGRALVNLLDIPGGEKITSMIPVREFDKRHLVMATERGVVKKTALEAFSRPRPGGIIALNLGKGDRLIGVRLVRRNEDAILATRDGQAIRFSESAVRAMGRPAAGVRGICLRKGDRVIGIAVGREESTLLTVCENGFGKRTRFSQYRRTNRGGIGVINIKTSARNGKVIGVLDVASADDVVMVTSDGMVVRVAVRSLRVIGRNTQGVKLVTPGEGARLVAAARVPSEQAEQEQVAAHADVADESTQASAADSASAEPQG